MRTLYLLLLLFTATAGAQQLIGVEDGDTLVVAIDGREKRVQLAGIDAPEETANPKFRLDLQRTGMGEETLLALGRAATSHLCSLAKEGDRLTLKGDLQQQDKYGRISLEVINSRGNSLNRLMVEQGYARALPDAPAEWRQLEQQALARSAGIWGQMPQAARSWLSSQADAR